MNNITLKLFKKLLKFLSILVQVSTSSSLQRGDNKTKQRPYKAECKVVATTMLV